MNNITPVPHYQQLAAAVEKTRRVLKRSKCVNKVSDIHQNSDCWSNEKKIYLKTNTVALYLNAVT
jgi:hypothetical protein